MRLAPLMRRLLPLLVPLLILGCASPRGLQAPDDYTLIGPQHMLEGYPARNEDGTVNVVVEIPTGTTAKWEVDKTDGSLRWEFRNGVPRVVQYLGYPGNYGMVPRTLLAVEDGGDGDPLDVLVIGDPVERGTVVRVNLLGVLRLLDGGEVDDKLIAVIDGHPFQTAKSLEDLQRSFPGVTTIIETWFTSYKGPGGLTSSGWGEAADAYSILDAAIATYGAR